MLFGRKPQIITCPSAINVLPSSDTEPLFIKLSSTVNDPNALIEVPAHMAAFILKSGDYSDPINSGSHEIFADKQEKKEWKKGHSLEIVFTAKDRPAEGEWEIIGDSSMIFRDSDSKETVQLKHVDGSFTVEVTNPTIFHRKVVGNRDIYRVSDLEREALNKIKTLFVDIFFNVIDDDDNKISFDSIAKHRRTIGAKVCDELNEIIKSHGYEFTSFDISMLDLDYSNANSKIRIKNDKSDFVSDLDAKVRAIRREEEDRRHQKEIEKMEIISKTKVGVAKASGGKQNRKVIETVVCPECGRENPADRDECIFCGADLDD